MIKAGSNLENVPFDVRCTLLHILYREQPCHRADAAASFSDNWPEYKKIISHQWRLVHKKRQLENYSRLEDKP